MPTDDETQDQPDQRTSILDGSIVRTLLLGYRRPLSQVRDGEPVLTDTDIMQAGEHVATHVNNLLRTLGLFDNVATPVSQADLVNGITEIIETGQGSARRKAQYIVTMLKGVRITS